MFISLLYTKIKVNVNISSKGVYILSKFLLSAFADEIDACLPKQMEVLGSHSISFIEMRGVNGKNISEYTPDQVRSIKRQLDSENFRISAIGSPIGKIMITDDFEPHFRLFQNLLDTAEILETRYMRIFSFFIPKDADPAIYRSPVIGRMEKLVSAAEKRGITLLHENEKDIYGDTAERCLDILESINSRFLRATFDPANFIQCGVNPYPVAYRLLKEHIEYIHIKDALFSTGNVVPAGEGDGKIKELLCALAESGYEGFLSLEPHLADFEGFQKLELRAGAAVNTGNDGEVKFSIAAEALNKILEDVKHG